MNDVYLRLHIFVYVCVCVCVHVFVWYACVCVSLRVCMCARVSLKDPHLFYYCVSHKIQRGIFFQAMYAMHLPFPTF